MILKKLIIINRSSIKKGKHKKINHKINIEGKLEFPIHFENEKINFQLITIVYHKGDSLDNGHYYVDIFCKSHKIYYRFNDELVEKNLKVNRQMENLGGFGTRKAYCLIYEKI